MWEYINFIPDDPTKQCCVGIRATFKCTNNQFTKAPVICYRDRESFSRTYWQFRALQDHGYVSIEPVDPDTFDVVTVVPYKPLPGSMELLEIYMTVTPKSTQVTINGETTRRYVSDVLDLPESRNTAADIIRDKLMHLLHGLPDILTEQVKCYPHDRLTEEQQVKLMEALDR